jgi:DNA mismatch repair protein MutS2
MAHPPLDRIENNMHSSLSSLEFPEVLQLIALEAKSDPGREALALRTPRRSFEECEELQGRLAEMVKYYHSEGLLPLAGLVDTSAVYQAESFTLAEAWTIVRAAKATQAVRESIMRNQDEYTRLRRLASDIPNLDAPLREVGHYFTKDGKLKEEASATLRSLRQRIHAKRASIQKSLNDLMTRHTDAVQEQIVTIRGERYCIPVRADRRGEVPGILHERSGSGASFFIEPIGVVEANNDLADLLIEEREEIVRITQQIARILFGAADDINAGVEIVGELDATQACALFYDAVDATRPFFTTERKLVLIEARHPLIDQRVADLRQSAFGERTQHQVVPLTVSVGDGSQALVISGPNAGGKTVALKTAGLIVAMAMSGLPVPAAEGTTIPVVDEFHVLIGDDQNLLESLSTFSAYLFRLKSILERATSHSLVLLDELGSGTDPEEGSALAASVVEHLTRIGALLIVTTHLTALKSFATEDLRIVNASMEYDLASGQPTFRMIQGLPGRSRAIEAARRVGLPSAIIEAAQKRLGEDYGKLDQLVAELQRRLDEARREGAELQRMREEAEREATSARAEATRLEEERKKLAGRYRDEADRVRDEIGSKLQFELKQLREMDRKEREKVTPSAIVQRVMSPIPAAVLKDDAGKIETGQQVEHRKFKVVGKVVSIDGSRAVIAIGGKTMQVELSDLRATGQPVKQTQTKRPEVSGSGEEPTIGAELNLVGQRVDDALEESDKFIDRALLNGMQAVRLIHGFGTGTLRKALREHLRKHPGVKTFRPGEKNEGGDGATIAVLDV